MRHLPFLLLSMVIMVCPACKYLLLRSEGIKPPAIENHQSLSKFLLSKGIDTTEILCFKDTMALNAFYKSGIGMPNARFFNKEKKFVDYKSAITDCNGMVSVFIEKVDSINLVPPIQGILLDEYLNNLVIEKNGQKFVLDDQGYEVYMIAYWAKYLGEVNKRKVYDWQERVKKINRDGKKIRMILVSVDYQEIWGITKDQLPEFDY